MHDIQDGINTKLKFEFYTCCFGRVILKTWLVMVGQGFDFLYVIDFIEDTGEETYLITSSFWF